MMPGTANLCHRREWRRAELTWGMAGDRHQGLVSIMDPEMQSSSMSALLLGGAEAGQLSLLCHISINFGLHQAAVLMKLPHSLEQWQESTQHLLTPTFCLPFFLASSRGLRTADVSPSLASHSPDPFEKLVFLGAVFPKYGPYMGSMQGAEHFLS